MNEWGMNGRVTQIPGRACSSHPPLGLAAFRRPQDHIRPLLSVLALPSRLYGSEEAEAARRLAQPQEVEEPDVFLSYRRESFSSPGDQIIRGPQSRLVPCCCSTQPAAGSTSHSLAGVSLSRCYTGVAASTTTAPSFTLLLFPFTPFYFCLYVGSCITRWLFGVLESPRCHS